MSVWLSNRGWAGCYGGLGWYFQPAVANTKTQADTNEGEMPRIEGTPHVTRTITGIMVKSEGFFN